MSHQLARRSSLLALVTLVALGLLRLTHSPSPAAVHPLHQHAG